MLVKNSGDDDPEAGAGTSKTTAPLQRPRRGKTGKHSNPNILTSRPDNLSDARDNTPSALTANKRIQQNSENKSQYMVKSRLGRNFNKKERKRQIKKLKKPSKVNEE